MNDDSHYSRTNPVTGTVYDPMKQPRYTEIATFMRAPMASSLDEVDIGLIGVPTDLGVTNRAGRPAWAARDPQFLEPDAGVQRRPGHESVRSVPHRGSRRRTPVASLRSGTAER